MKKIIIIILFLKTLHSFSQNYKVIDFESKQPVQFATIKLIKDGKLTNGFYTDENGSFTLNSEKNYQIVVSCIGYQTKNVTIDNTTNSIEIEKKIYNLDEVVITVKKDIQIGFIDAKNSKDIVGVSLGLEVAVFIENKLDYPALIKSVQFKVKKTKEKIAYRLHLYEISENNLKPGDDLLNENFIYYIEPKVQGLIDIDLSEYNIVLPKKGVFVCIEGVDGLNTNSTKSEDNNLKFLAPATARIPSRGNKMLPSSA